MKLACGADVATMMTHFEEKRFGPLLKSINCVVDTSDYAPWPASSTGVTASSVVIASAAAVSVLIQLFL